MSGLKLPAALQTPQKEKQVTAKKTPEKKEEDDEYAGSTDVDEPGWHQALFNVTELYLTFLPASVFRLNFLSGCYRDKSRAHHCRNIYKMKAM